MNSAWVPPSPASKYGQRMLEFKELEQVRRFFGCSELQVRRDHAISHVLDALQKMRTEMVFFGGTALSRTYLTEGRLSEDIDLYSNSRDRVCRELDHLPEMIEQEFPAANWEFLPSQVVDPKSALLNVDSVIKIRIQVLDAPSRDWDKIPTRMTSIHQRYSDVRSTQLVAPTLDSFAAMKVLAWFDRQKPRDLFDLAAISKLGNASDGARHIVQKFVGHDISEKMLNRKIHGSWIEELAHQTRLEVTEEECLSNLLKWWRKADSS